MSYLPPYFCPLKSSNTNVSGYSWAFILIYLGLLIICVTKYPFCSAHFILFRLMITSLLNIHIIIAFLTSIILLLWFLLCGTINHILVLPSPKMSHEPRCPKSNIQEFGDSTSDCIPLVPKESCQKSNRLEPIGSTSDRITSAIKKICHVQNQNKITAPSISNTY